jgi:hypothetical protein
MKKVSPPPNLYPANPSLTKSADGSMTSVATRLVSSQASTLTDLLSAIAPSNKTRSGCVGDDSQMKDVAGRHSNAAKC